MKQLYTSADKGRAIEIVVEGITGWYDVKFSIRDNTKVIYITADLNVSQ